mgnify:CR=1 FL=1
MAGFRGHHAIVELLIEAGAEYDELINDHPVIMNVLKTMKEDLCTDFMKNNHQRTHGHTRESLMELEFRELKAMVEGHPCRIFDESYLVSLNIDTEISHQ